MQQQVEQTPTKRPQQMGAADYHRKQFGTPKA